jgi:catechol 2,3-dioxygenase-like lactoylglutathione lyase family enzyme
MEQRISLITLGVSDLDRASAFYDRMGWQRSVAQAQGVVFYQVGPMAVALFPRSELAADAVVTDDSKPGAFVPVALAYNTRTADEVDAILANAAAAGGRIVKSAEKAFWGGYSGYFADPDGFLWEVAHNTGFALADDGSLLLPD